VKVQGDSLKFPVIFIRVYLRLYLKGLKVFLTSKNPFEEKNTRLVKKLKALLTKT
jgi:hypothetical protein